MDQLQLSTESMYEGKNSKVYSALDKATGVTVLLKWYEKAQLSDLNRCAAVLCCAVLCASYSMVANAV